MFLDIHTHKSPPATDRAIVNVLKNFASIPETGWYSAGLHPWYLNNDSLDTEMEQLEKALLQTNLLAIGECGLDKVCNTDYSLQQNAFRKQVQLANRLHKPLIIHCVKAFDDVLKILKEEAVSSPVIFHGFNKSPELAGQILKAGYHLSFGRHLSQPVTAAVFNSIPLNHLFLETDAANIGIGEIYIMAAAIKNISVTALEEQIADNVARVFGKINL